MICLQEGSRYPDSIYTLVSKQSHFKYVGGQRMNCLGTGTLIPYTSLNPYSTLLDPLKEPLWYPYVNPIWVQGPLGLTAG